jgi:hypothetical protein
MVGEASGLKSFLVNIRDLDALPLLPQQPAGADSAEQGRVQAYSSQHGGSNSVTKQNRAWFMLHASPVFLFCQHSPVYLQVILGVYLAAGCRLGGPCSRTTCRFNLRSLPGAGKRLKQGAAYCKPPVAARPAGDHRPEGLRTKPTTEVFCLPTSACQNSLLRAPLGIATVPEAWGTKRKPQQGKS